MKKTVIIDEILRDEIIDGLQKESAYADAIEKLSMSMAREKAKAWTLIYKNYPEAAKQGLRADLKMKTWELIFEQEEYTREGENVIEEIHPIFDEVHTPPPLEKGKIN